MQLSCVQVQGTLSYPLKLEYTWTMPAILQVFKYLLSDTNIEHTFIIYTIYAYISLHIPHHSSYIDMWICVIRIASSVCTYVNTNLYSTSSQYSNCIKHTYIYALQCMCIYNISIYAIIYMYYISALKNHSSSSEYNITWPQLLGVYWDEAPSPDRQVQH